VPECLRKCEGIVANILRVSFGSLAEPAEPFILHADEYKLDKRLFAEDLKEYLELLRTALKELIGEEGGESVTDKR